VSLSEMVDFRKFIESFIKLIKHEEKHISSNLLHIREKAAKHLDKMLPHLRNVTEIYIRKFCNEPAIASNPVYLSSLRVDILEKVREHVDVKLPKTYAKMLQTRIK